MFRAGKLRPLAVTTRDTLGGLPDIPPVGEFVPGSETSTSGQALAPQEYARRDCQQAQQGNQRGPRRPQDQGRLADLGGTVLPGSPSDFGKLIADDTEKWGNVIWALNIKAE